MNRRNYNFLSILMKIEMVTMMHLRYAILDNGCWWYLRLSFICLATFLIPWRQTTVKRECKFDYSLRSRSIPFDYFLTLFLYCYSNLVFQLSYAITFLLYLLYVYFDTHTISVHGPKRFYLPETPGAKTAVLAIVSLWLSLSTLAIGLALQNKK